MRALDPRDLELQGVVNSPAWVLGAELQFPGKVPGALNH